MQSWFAACWLVSAGLALTPAVAAAASPSPSTERVMMAEPPRTIPDFTLTNQNGKPRHLSDLRGETLLVFFGFTHCANVCPATMHMLKAAHESKDRAIRRARVVMVSIDGERDTPPVMKSYLAAFSPDFVGLTGDPRVVRDIAQQFSALFFKGPPTNAAGDYQMEHTSQVYLVDRSGRLRATFFNAPIETLVKVTRTVLDEKS
jgi:protein SCO1